MSFEGSEKKVEVVLKKGVNLLNVEEEFWVQLVKKAEAQILSSLKNKKCHSYLLSESSLFVWSDRIVLITCGQTSLVEAVIFFLEKYGVQDIASLIYQRKNESFSHLQKSSFIDDVAKLKELVLGECYRFGKIHEHHNFMFCSQMPYEPSFDDCTLELLMYDIQGDKEGLLLKSSPKDAIRNFFQFQKLFPNYKIDDFVFDPIGYSVNGIKEDLYFTIHVTPEFDSSYISFETNDFNLNIAAMLLSIVCPESFDLVTFNRPSIFKVPNTFHKRSSIEEKINLGYNVTFDSYFEEASIIGKAHTIKEVKHEY